MTSESRRVGLAVLLLAAACHGSVEQVPLADDRVTPRDRWLDVVTFDGRDVLVVGDRGKVLRSEDGGERWARIEVPTDRALTRIAFASPERGWIVGQDGVILATADGGRTWKPQQSGTPSHLFAVAALDGEVVYACGDRSTWLETRDGGATWHGRAVPLSDVGLDPEIALAVEEPIYYDLDFIDEANGWMVGDYGNIRRTRDGGQTWESQHGSLLGQRMANARRPLRDALDLPALFRVAVRDGGHGIAVGVGGTVLTTTDGGASWTIEPPKVEPPLETPLLEIAFAGDATFVFGGSGTAFAAGKGGWRAVDLRLPLLTWIAAADFARAGDLAGKRGFAVGGRGLLMRTDDAGVTWRPLAAAPGRPG